MAVLTNKPVRPSRDICAHFGLSKYFFQNTGQQLPYQEARSDGAAGADGGGFCSRGGGDRAGAGPILPSETAMIGDSDVDVLTARNCGARSVGCLFGLAPPQLAAAEPDAVVSTPLEWVQALRELGGAATQR